MQIKHSFPGGSVGKEPACNAGDLGLIPGSGRSPGERHGNPLQYSCLEKSPMDRGTTSYSPQCHKKLDMTERLTHFQRHLYIYSIYIYLAYTTYCVLRNSQEHKYGYCLMKIQSSITENTQNFKIEIKKISLYTEITTV